jgi:hypothetical protein
MKTATITYTDDRTLPRRIGVRVWCLSFLGERVQKTRLWLGPYSGQ